MTAITLEELPAADLTIIRRFLISYFPEITLDEPISGADTVDKLSEIYNLIKDLEK